MVVVGGLVEPRLSHDGLGDREEGLVRRRMKMRRRVEQRLAREWKGDEGR